MATTLEIPSGPTELSPDWLTRALRTGGAIRDANVTAFEATVIGEGVGVLGQLARLTLTYDRPEDGAPATMVAKFPASAAENREIGKLFRFYERENRFYEQLTGKIALRTPRCYYSAMEPEAAQHVLLIEDFAPARMGDQLAGCSAGDAQLAVRRLAEFHAGWWDSPRLAEVDWIPFSSDPVVTAPVDQSYGQAWEPFLKAFGDRLSPEMLKVGERLITKAVKILEQVDEAPKTIAHGDYRLDNMFFGVDGPGSFAVIDWQISIRMRGTYDVAYFMSQSVNPAERKANEMAILRLYHDTLQEHGVRDYDFDQCLKDYRLATLFCLAYPVISGGQLDLANERGGALVAAMLDRSVSAIQDLDAAELMPA